MYSIQKAPCFTDKLELRDEAGKSLVLDIRLQVTPQAAGQYRRLQVRLLDLQKAARENPGDPAIVEQIGQAVAEVLSLLLGTDNLQEMTQFYDGDYITMLSDVFPYIQQVIAPQFSALAEARKKQLKRRFK